MKPAGKLHLLFSNYQILGVKQTAHSGKTMQRNYLRFNYNSIILLITCKHKATLQTLTLRSIRELRTTLIILKLFQKFTDSVFFNCAGEFHWTNDAAFFKLCHVTWMQSQLLRHPERWGMCRCCPSIQNMLWSTDNAFHYGRLGEYLIMFSRPDVLAAACEENPKEIFHTILQLCINLFYASRKWRAVLL